MSEPGHERLADCEEALQHPLRRTLFTLLLHRPASATELRLAVDQPLESVNYHLRILVERQCLEARVEGQTTTYRPDPRTAPMLSLLGGPGASGRIVLMSLLDAAWAAIGRSPQGTPLAPRWETFSLDEEGLSAASATIREALERIKAIAGLSRERQRERSQKEPTHTLVAVASLVELPPEEAGGQAP
ncbi:MAG: hypothetical protein ACM3JL_00680 [Nitrososphaerota archaeon]